MPRGRSIRTPHARATFLAKLAECCNVSESARCAGISRSAAYDWRDDDAAFAEDWDAAEQEAIDRLEETAWKRATEDKSDRMLEILLKAHRPEKYVERFRAEHTGRDGGPIEYRNLSDEEIEQRIRAHEAARADNRDAG